jgi:hypothetical protein
MHKGVCVGGPMAGQTITTYSDAGFVAVDKPGSACWVYMTDPADGRFVLCTDPDPALLDPDGTRALDEARLAGAAGHDLDVIALPGDDTEEPAAPPVIDDSSDLEDGED